MAVSYASFPRKLFSNLWYRSVRFCPPLVGCFHFSISMELHVFADVESVRGFKIVLVNDGLYGGLNRLLGIHNIRTVVVEHEKARLVSRLRLNVWFGMKARSRGDDR